MPYFKTTSRNICMFTSIGVAFFVLPVLMLIMVLATQFSSDEDADAAVDSTTPGPVRLLEDTEGLEPVTLVRAWCLLSISFMILFGYIELFNLMIKLKNNYWQPEKVKNKIKDLGGYSKDDPLRRLAMGESIYSLAFAVNLTGKAMNEVECGDKIGIPDSCRPSSMARAEINLTAIFCGFCQIFTSYLLLLSFSK